MYPIVILTGKAKSGKSTVADLICKKTNAISIALADPIKRYVRDVFGFTNEVCWGPSEMRSTEITITDGNRNFDIKQKMEYHIGEWTSSLLDNVTSNDLRKLRSKTKELAQNDKLSLRKALQEIGTGWGRKVDNDIWARYAIKTAQNLLYGGYGYNPENGLYIDGNQKGYDLVVISDGRFRNEILKVKELNGESFHIVREMKIEGEASQHPSETEQDSIPPTFFEGVIKNNGTLADLENAVDELIQYTGEQC